MSNRTELDNIISEGKVNASTAMVIFAVELKAQGEKMDALTQTINQDNQRYATKDDHMTLSNRVSRLENGILGMLLFVFVAVMTAIIGLVIRNG